MTPDTLNKKMNYSHGGNLNCNPKINTLWNKTCQEDKPFESNLLLQWDAIDTTPSKIWTTGSGRAFVSIKMNYSFHRNIQVETNAPSNAMELNYEDFSECHVKDHEDARMFYVTSVKNMNVNIKCKSTYHSNISWFNTFRDFKCKEVGERERERVTLQQGREMNDEMKSRGRPTCNRIYRNPFPDLIHSNISTARRWGRGREREAPCSRVGRWMTGWRVEALQL